MNQIKAYLSHAIRGAKRMDATKEDIWRNCNEALAIAIEIRKSIPEIEMWVPAEHEELVQIGFEKGIFCEETILDIDCEILSKRDLLIVLRKNGLESNGMRVEIDYARRKNIPIVYFEVEWKLAGIEKLKKIIYELLEKKRMI